MPTFLNIYKSKDKDDKSKLIRKITHEWEIADITFYRKISRLEKRDINAFNKLEKEWLATFLKTKIFILFPTNEKVSSKKC